jgi:hypothetical protein
MKAPLRSVVFVLFVALLFLRSCEVIEPPACKISEPSDGFRAIVGDLIPVSINAGQEKGNIAEVRLFLNKSALTTLEYPFQYKINTSDFRPGNYSIEAIAVDELGLKSKDEVDFILHPIGWNDPG